MAGPTSEVAGSIFGRDGVPSVVAGLGFVAALYLFARDLQALGAVNDWWGDELFSLWATDPRQRFVDALVQRILPDSNPPLYYVLLYWTRQIISDARSATTILNLLALGAAMLSVLYVSKRTGNLPLGLVGCAAFLLSGPVLRYTAEGRSYLSALALTFVASWLCATLLVAPRRPPAWLGFAIVSALGAMIHVYSALMCCCLAAGLMAAAWSWRRSDLWAPSYALGIPAGSLTVAWLAYARNAGLFPYMSWIQFSPARLIRSAGEVVLLALPTGVDIGSVDLAAHTPNADLRNALLMALPGAIAFGLIVVIFCLGLASRPLRAVSAAFGVCFLLFFALPVAASVKQPIIVGRYWMIGAPAIIVLLLFFIRRWIKDLAANAQRRNFSLGAAAATIALLGWTTFNGFSAARALVISKPGWSGAALVTSRSGSCPPRSIHILVHYPSSLSVATYSYTFVSKLPATLFVPVIVNGADINEYPSLDDPSCPVLGWAEHAVPDVVHLNIQSASDRQLLDLLRIGVATAKVTILRHRMGYVVLWRNP